MVMKELMNYRDAVRAIDCDFIAIASREILARKTTRQRNLLVI